MTNKITGIDIRKALIAAKLRPSNYDEQGIYNYIHDPAHAELDEMDFTPKVIAEIAEMYYRL